MNENYAMNYGNNAMRGNGMDVDPYQTQHATFYSNTVTVTPTIHELMYVKSR